MEKEKKKFKPKFKLAKEFIAFINKGSVLDLAVGMIIGSAFTAIVTALVSGILTPLINMIDLGDGESLQVILKDPVYNDAGEIIKDAVIMDFGSIISAVITFICTALVLFAIIKVISVAKEAGKFAKKEADKAAKKLTGKDEVEEVKEEAAPIEEPVQEQPVVEEVKVASESTDELLKEIRDLLKAQSEKKDAE